MNASGPLLLVQMEHLVSRNYWMKMLELDDNDPVDNGWFTCLCVCDAVVLICFVAAELSGNYSQTDKLWSLMPCVYVWILNVFANGSNPRLLLVTFIVSLWSIRLTLNFNRHGGYAWPPWRGAEDYRWVSVQKLLRAEEYPWLWTLFDLTIIAGFFQALLLLQAAPAYVVARLATPKDFGVMDFVVGGAALLCIVVETAADEQQQAFQREKAKHKNKRKKPAEVADGFISSGLFWFCRHPNYAAEQAFWMCIYGFAVITLPQENPLHWTGLGAVLLVMLFAGSAWFSESLQAEKYPDYVHYQRSTFMFLPFGTHGSWAKLKGA